MFYTHIVNVVEIYWMYMGFYMFDLLLLYLYALH
jgi:hypothetical protein